jgi:hypothetical protein
MVASGDSLQRFRVGRAPDPVALPPFDAVGTGRFDDPARRFRVLYTAEAPICAFLESLAAFRPPLRDLLPMVQGMPGSREPVIGRVPRNWHLKRLLVTIRLYPGQHWLDFRAAEVHTLLSEVFAEQLSRLGYDTLDARAAVSLDRPFTQGVSRWAYERGFQGIIYTSRIDTRQTCWALLEGAHFLTESVAAIPNDDPVLMIAARALSLHLSA